MSCRARGTAANEKGEGAGSVRGAGLMPERAGPEVPGVGRGRAGGKRGMRVGVAVGGGQNRAGGAGEMEKRLSRRGER